MKNCLRLESALALLALVATSCGDDTGGGRDVKAEGEGERYWPSWASKKWTTDKPGWWLWGGRPLTEAEKREADDLTKFHESAFSKWKDTLNHGYVPKFYLSNPRVVFDDVTKGELPGMEKIRPVLTRISEKCGAYSPSRKQGIPIRVLWMDSYNIKQSRLGNVVAAFRTGSQTGMDGLFGSEEAKTPRGERPKEPALGVQTTMTTENLIYVWGGKTEEERKADGTSSYGEIGFDPKTRTWKQTWKDYFGTEPGGKPSMDEPQKVWPAWRRYYNFLIEDHTADQAFAHELGHAFLVEWALSNGRSAIWTRTFDEMFAEMFADICYNDQYLFEEEERYVDGKRVYWGWKPTDGGLFYGLTGVGKEYFFKEDCGKNVNCDSLAKFIRADPLTPLLVDKKESPNEVKASHLDPNKYIAPYTEEMQHTLAAEGRWSEAERKKIFDAVLKTLDAMQGVRLAECAPLTVAGNIKWIDPMGEITLGEPRQHPYAGECPWGMNEGDRVLPLEQRPLAFTAREFWTLFPTFYELPKRHQETARSITDTLNTVWEY